MRCLMGPGAGMDGSTRCSSVTSDVACCPGFSLCSAPMMPAAGFIQGGSLWRCCWPDRCCPDATSSSERCVKGCTCHVPSNAFMNPCLALAKRMVRSLSSSSTSSRVSNVTAMNRKRATALCPTSSLRLPHPSSLMVRLKVHDLMDLKHLALASMSRSYTSWGLCSTLALSCSSYKNPGDSFTRICCPFSILSNVCGFPSFSFGLQEPGCVTTASSAADPPDQPWDPLSPRLNTIFTRFECNGPAD
mmetsp:Transcript_34995/g.88615  ORF Transcript_34995/g.88615 Transcript_34995/m.88615 type:complete len:246 (+) Transcript_34995:836-1573(+)